MHAELQHTPSAVQNPWMQSEFALHGFPSGSWVPHWLVVLRQVRPPVQSPSEVHVVRHEGLVELHRYGSQAWVVAVGQWPAPSQLAAGVKVALVQLAWRHPVEVDHAWQAPLPLQRPSFEQSPLVGSLLVQRCFGSGDPWGTAEQVPTLFVTLQLMQSPPLLESAHAVLQQTPSVQKPLRHSAPEPHAMPFGLRPQ